MLEIKLSPSDIEVSVEIDEEASGTGNRSASNTLQ